MTSKTQSSEVLVADPREGGRRSSRKARAEPDAVLARDPLVQYRYALRIAEPSDARVIFEIVDALGAALRYLVLVKEGTHQRYRAYLGLGSSDCFDVPLRMAARGIHIERGEQVRNDVDVGDGTKVTVLRRP